MGIDDIAVRLENRIPVVDIFVELKNSSLFLKTRCFDNSKTSRAIKTSVTVN